MIGINSCPHALGFAAPVRASLMVSRAAKMDSCPLSAISLWNASRFGLSVSWSAPIFSANSWLSCAASRMAKMPPSPRSTPPC